MPEVAGIRFKPCGKIYSFDMNGIAVKPGMWIVVLSEMGLSLGLVVKAKHNVKQSDQQFKKILRIATVCDLEADRNNQTLEDEARSFWIEKVKNLNLSMKVIGTEATLDRKRLVFYFTAEGRIDFRELVRDLASKFKTRIEMRQIGVRDEVKFIGGIGCCGREVCCRVFLTSFEPISIRMAKKQELVLNPGKLSGICGRLMCCLGYEIGASPQKSFKEKILNAETKARDMTVTGKTITETVSSVDKVSCPAEAADSLSDKEKNLPRQPSDAPAEPKPKEKQEKPYIPKKKDKGRDRGKPFSKRKKFWKKKKK